MRANRFNVFTIHKQHKFKDSKISLGVTNLLPQAKPPTGTYPVVSTPGFRWHMVTLPVHML